jgi:hypothetical protein
MVCASKVLEELLTAHLSKAQRKTHFSQNWSSSPLQECANINTNSHSKYGLLRNDQGQTHIDTSWQS